LNTENEKRMNNHESVLEAVETAVLSNRRRGRARIGVFNVGFHRYWPQFPGLRERLEGYRQEFEQRLRGMGAEVISAGLVDDVASGRRAGDFFGAQHVDVIFCFVTTYVQSAYVVPVAQRSKAYMVLIGLQPTPGMDAAHATTAEQLAHDNCTSLPEIVYGLKRAGLPSGIIFGMLHDDPRAWSRIQEWVLAARAVNALRNARIGLLGHPFEGMLDMNADPTAFQGAFGMHVDMIEMCDFKKRVDEVSPAAVDAMKGRINGFFCFPEPGADSIAGRVTPEALDWSARVACGLEKLVDDFHLDGLAHYYRGVDGNDYERLIAGIIVGASLLTAEGVPVAGEGDLKNCVAMLAMDRLDAGGSFTELHPADFTEDFVFVGHDGPGHVAISNEKPALRGLSLFHGKFGNGVSVEFKVKHGPVTISGLTLNDAGRFQWVLAEGESVPGTIPATGNTNTRCRFKPDMPTFIERWSEAGPTHHFALGIGRRISAMKKVAALLGMDCVVVAE
jgi:L-arabinose isomerase